MDRLGSGEALTQLGWNDNRSAVYPDRFEIVVVIEEACRIHPGGSVAAALSARSTEELEDFTKERPQRRGNPAP